MTARRLGIPSVDDVRLRVGLAPAPARLPRRDEGRRPGRDPARAARALRREPATSSCRYPGLKEEYYLADFEPDPAALRALGVDARPRRSSCCARRRTSRSTTATRTRSSRRRSSASAATTDVHAVVLPRTDEQREYVRGSRSRP